MVGGKFYSCSALASGRWLGSQQQEERILDYGLIQESLLHSESHCSNSEVVGTEDVFLHLASLQKFVPLRKKEPKRNKSNHQFIHWDILKCLLK